jgi:shikimate kinase
MPGCGQSTVGGILAKRTNRDFIDTDVLIQISEKRSLQDIVDHDGHMALRKIEEDVLLQLKCTHCIIATGGSAAYSDLAMKHLQSLGKIVFLNIPLETIQKRVKDFSTRGLAKRPDQTLQDLFEERLELYFRYADAVIGGDSLTQEETCDEIVAKIGPYPRVAK